jgi:membrane-associated phospholipid phosphatase
MSKLILTLIIVLMAIFIGLAIFSRFFAPINLLMRRHVEINRNLRLRPLMIMTHRYNDVLSLSVQLIALALLLGLIWHDWGRAMVLMAAMFIQTTIVSFFKRLSSIDRPPQLISHVIMTTGSYPSGHSAASMTFALLVPTVLMPYIPLSVLIVLATYLFCIALLTAYGRLYLDVHWLTDIVGGWALAGATFMLSRQFLV